MSFPKQRAMRRLSSPARWRSDCTAKLDVKAEEQDVPVLHDIILAFGPHFPGVLGTDLAAELDVVVIGDRLGADEATLEVRVDLTGGLRSLRAPVGCPGAGFLRSRREESDESEQSVAGMDHPVETRFVQAEV